MTAASNGWARRGPSDQSRTRGRKWMAIRASILERDGLACVECAKAGKQVRATKVDHVTPIAKGGTDDPSNLQSLCTECHDAKSASEGVRVAKVRSAIGLDGWPTR